MDPLTVFMLLIGMFLAGFSGAITGVMLTEKYYDRQQNNKLYDTLFSPEPIGDRLITPEEAAALSQEHRGNDCIDCETDEKSFDDMIEEAERTSAPYGKSGRGRKVVDVGWPDDMEQKSGWQDNHAAGDWPVRPRETKPLPGSLGRE